MGGWVIKRTKLWLAKCVSLCRSLSHTHFVSLFSVVGLFSTYPPTHPPTPPPPLSTTLLSPALLFTTLGRV